MVLALLLLRTDANPRIKNYSPQTIKSRDKCHELSGIRSLIFCETPRLSCGDEAI